MNALSRLFDRLHAETDAAALAAGWTVTRTGWGGRSYGWTKPAADRRDLALHPVLIALDECQRAFEHPEHGAEIAALVEDLVKRGPAVVDLSVCRRTRSTRSTSTAPTFGDVA